VPHRGQRTWVAARTARRARARDAEGALVATRAFFPATVRSAVRQKTRWVHGIALQCWDRLGWPTSVVDKWMVLRDRRGPLLALVLAAAYLLALIEGALLLAEIGGYGVPQIYPPVLRLLMLATFAGVFWRALWRFVLTSHEYGIDEGLLAVARIPVANVIAILAGRRALAAYVGTLFGVAVRWDKTEHAHHPAARSGAVVS
jgi:adsorption protein B